MKRTGQIFFMAVFILLQNYLLAPVAVSQITLATQVISTDSLYRLAREYAFNSRKPDARKICYQILSRDSTYHDAAVLLGRTYAWDEKYDSAKLVLTKILRIKPGYYDAIDALIDASLYDLKYNEAISYADIGLEYHPKEINFLFKKARALNNDGQTQQASDLLSKILQTNPSDKSATDLLSSIRSGKRVNKVKLDYWTDYFKDDQSWRFASVAFSRRTKLVGTLILRYNYAQRFGKQGNQWEVDAYPTLAKGIYLYFNTGISNKVNFPFSRLSLEPYFKLPRSFEFSIGIRYLNFDDNRLITLDSTKVSIYTGSIGKYYGNYWFSLRPYLVPGKDGWSKSVNLTIRRYLDDYDSYLSLILGTGLSPDEQSYAFNPTLNYLKSTKISLEYRQKFASCFYLDLGTGFAREEIRYGVKREKYSLDVGVSYLF